MTQHLIGILLHSDLLLYIYRVVTFKTNQSSNTLFGQLWWWWWWWWWWRRRRRRRRRRWPWRRRPARINNQTEIVNGERILYFQSVPRGHYLVWWVRVRVRVSIGVRIRVMVRVRVRVRVRVSNLFGSR